MIAVGDFHTNEPCATATRDGSSEPVATAVHDDRRGAGPAGSQAARRASLMRVAPIAAPSSGSGDDGQAACASGARASLGAISVTSMTTSECPARTSFIARSTAWSSRSVPRSNRRAPRRPVTRERSRSPWWLTTHDAVDVAERALALPIGIAGKAASAVAALEGTALHKLPTGALGATGPANPPTGSDGCPAAHDP